MVILAVAVLLILQGFHTGSAVTPKPATAPTLRPIEQPFDNTCMWMPDNVVGTWWYYYCAPTKPGDPPTYKKVSGVYILGSPNAQEAQDAWVRASKVKGEALANSIGKPDPTSSQQHRSFVMPGSEGTPDPCDLMNGTHGGAGLKREFSRCIYVKNLLEQRNNPCGEIPVPELRGICLNEHPEWTAMSRPLDPGTLPSCSRNGGSICTNNHPTSLEGKKEGEEKDFVEDPIGWIRDASLDAVQITTLWWVTAPDPLISTNDKDCKPDKEPVKVRHAALPCSGNTVSFLTRHTNALTYGLSILCVVLAGVKLAFSRDVGSVKDAIKGVLTLILVAGSTVFLVNVTVRMGQGYSDWIVLEGLAPDAGGGADPDQELQLAIGKFTQGLDQITSFPVFMMAVVIIVPSNVVEFGMMTVPSFIAPVMVGVMPLFASVSSTAYGRALLRTNITGLAAFVLLKPATVTIFVAGAKLWAPPGGAQLQWAEQFRGLIVLVLVTWLGPATVRFVFTIIGPATGSTSARTEATSFTLTTGARVVASGANLIRHR
ncbi:hypothetical protein [Embleya hyalina]|uniref:hypothetical protein n=1 Tax=Embleya hyalina TaxID=516124 RepID=UPI000F8391C1|nr:hypothetical protein [Embleya hyalina]